MYLLYEHHKNPEGEILVTDMVMTSFFPGKPGISFKTPLENALFEFSKRIFKEIHTKQRSYDPETNIWSFFPPSGAQVYAQLRSSPMGPLLKFEAIKDLAGQKAAGWITKPSASQIDPADFFYTPEAPTATLMSKELLRAKLALLLALPEPSLESMSLAELKKPYRVAALRLHPDRNAGNGEAMSELNSLWLQWKPYASGGS